MFFFGTLTVDMGVFDRCAGIAKKVYDPMKHYLGLILVLIMAVLGSGCPRSLPNQLSLINVTGQHLYEVYLTAGDKTFDAGCLVSGGTKTHGGFYRGRFPRSGLIGIIVTKGSEELSLEFSLDDESVPKGYSGNMSIVIRKDEVNQAGSYQVQAFPGDMFEAVRSLGLRAGR